MKKVLDYLYSKSQLKQKQDALIKVQRTELVRRGEELGKMHLRWRKLKNENYSLQMFIEENVSEEKKNKFFKRSE